MFGKHPEEDWKGETEDPREWLAEVITWALNDGDFDEAVMATKDAPQLKNFVEIPVKALANATFEGTNERGERIPEEKIPRDGDHLLSMQKKTLELMLKALVVSFVDASKKRKLTGPLEGKEIKTKYQERLQENVELAIDGLLEEVNQYVREEQEA